MNASSSSQRSARATLSGLELRCPPLPHTLTEALQLMEHPERLEVGPVAEMVQRDPIVVARLLHIVNSAYYGLRHQVTSADRAIVMLGPVAVAGIVVGMHMIKLRTVLEGPAAACFTRLIRHSIATAFLTRHLMEVTPRPQHAATRSSHIGASFTAGLLHDFGKIILVYNFPEQAVAFYDEQTLDQQVSDTDANALEQLVFGYDHAEAGEYLARKFNFPDLLTDVIRLHHAPDAQTGTPETDRLIRATAAANTAAKTMGYAFTHPLSREDALRDPVWELLLRHDWPHLDTPEALLDRLAEQQPYLDESIQNLTVAEDGNLTQEERLRRVEDTLLR